MRVVLPCTSATGPTSTPNMLASMQALPLTAWPCSVPHAPHPATNDVHAPRWLPPAHAKMMAAGRTRIEDRPCLHCKMLFSTLPPPLRDTVLCTALQDCFLAREVLQRGMHMLRVMSAWLCTESRTPLRRALLHFAASDNGYLAAALQSITSSLVLVGIRRSLLQVLPGLMLSPFIKRTTRASRRIYIVKCRTGAHGHTVECRSGASRTTPTYSIAAARMRKKKKVDYHPVL
jgi:hypothetical protein